MATLLLTGSTGFIGCALAPALLRAGYRLRVAVREPGRALKGAEVVRIDGLDETTDWRAAVRGVETVVHLAGLAHVTGPAARQAMPLSVRMNWGASLGLARAAAEAGARRVLFMSTAHVLGLKTLPGQPFADGSEPRPVGAYASSKLAAEDAMAEVAAQAGQSFVALRPPLVAGVGARGNLARLTALLRRPVPLPLLGIANRRTLMTRDGLVDAVLTVLARWRAEPVSGRHLVACRQPISTSALASALRAGLPGGARLVPLPGPVQAALKALGAPGPLHQLLGDLEVDGRGFATRFGWTPPDDPLDALTALARAAAARSA